MSRVVEGGVIKRNVLLEHVFYEDLPQLQEKIEGILKDLVPKAIAEIAAYLFDKSILEGYTFNTKPYYQARNLVACGVESTGEISHQGKIKQYFSAEQHLDGFHHDFNFKLKLWSIDDAVLALPVTKVESLQEIFRGNYLGWQEYDYWDDVEPPEAIKRKDWDQRRTKWIIATSMRSLEWSPLDYRTMSLLSNSAKEVCKMIPSKTERAKRFIDCDIIYRSSEHYEKFEEKNAGGAFAYLTSFQEWKESRDGRGDINTEIEKIASQLPEITEEILY